MSADLLHRVYSPAWRRAQARKTLPSILYVDSSCFRLLGRGRFPRKHARTSTRRVPHRFFAVSCARWPAPKSASPRSAAPRSVFLRTTRTAWCSKCTQSAPSCCAWPAIAADSLSRLHAVLGPHARAAITRRLASVSLLCLPCICIAARSSIERYEITKHGTLNYTKVRQRCFALWVVARQAVFPCFGASEVHVSHRAWAV